MVVSFFIGSFLVFRPNLQPVGLARAKISKFPLQSYLTTKSRAFANSLHFILTNDKQKGFLAVVIYFLGKNIFVALWPKQCVSAANVKELARNAKTGNCFNLGFLLAINLRLESWEQRGLNDL